MQLKATTLGGISRLINAAKARGNGVDIDMDAVITDSFTLSGGVEFLDAKFTSFPGAPCPLDLPQGGVNGTITCDLAGQRLPFAPTMSGNIRADYMFAGLGGEFDVSLGDGLLERLQFRAGRRNPPARLQQRHLRGLLERRRRPLPRGRCGAATCSTRRYTASARPTLARDGAGQGPHVRDHLRCGAVAAWRAAPRDSFPGCRSVMSLIGSDVGGAAIWW